MHVTSFTRLMFSMRSMVQHTTVALLGTRGSSVVECPIAVRTLNGRRDSMSTRGNLFTLFDSVVNLAYNTKATSKFKATCLKKPHVTFRLSRCSFQHRLSMIWPHNGSLLAE